MFIFSPNRSSSIILTIRLIFGVIDKTDIFELNDKFYIDIKYIASASIPVLKIFTNNDYHKMYVGEIIKCLIKE